MTGIFDSPDEVARAESKVLMVNKLRAMYSDRTAIWMPFNTPSSKNSKKVHSIKTKYSTCCDALIEGYGKDSTCTKCGRTYDSICPKCKTKLFDRKTVPKIADSDATKKYKELTKGKWKELVYQWRAMVKGTSYPYFTGLFFHRESQHKWDFNNISQVLQDLMRDYDWIAEDDTRIIIPVYLGEKHEKNNPGCIITLLDNNYFTNLHNHLRHVNKNNVG